MSNKGKPASRRPAPTRAGKPAAFELDQLPGYYIRRLQQIAVALFIQETEAVGVTPVQFGALQSIANAPGLDQRTLARTIGFDTSTIGSVVDRLEAKGLVQRSASAHDRRVRLLTLTPRGAETLAAVQPLMLRAQERILEPLPARERVEFMRMLKALVQTNNEMSRAPSEA